jgi:glucokinase
VSTDSSGSIKSPGCTIGLDVGGTKIAGGVVLFPSGHVFTRKTIPTKLARGGEAVLVDSLELAAELTERAQAANLSVQCLGVVVCELVDLQGNVTSDQTIAWRGIPLGERFSTIAPTVIESDVRGAALAEALFGAGRGLELFVYVTVGTGISYSLVQTGKPYTGARGNAMLIGNSPFIGTCANSGFDSSPTLEDLASGPALVASYNRATDMNLSRAEQVIAAAQEGDPIATQIVRQAGEALGTGVGLLVNVLDPEAVIIGGGLGLAGGLYWESLIESARRHIWSDADRALPILKGSLGTDAAMIGAAAFAWTRLSANI